MTLDRKNPELFAPERPVRSDFARQSGLSYGVRRLITMAVLVGLVTAGGMWAWGRVTASHSGEIPTIKADSSYKQKPEQPGGIDIPHQDVQVYHEIDGSAVAENAKPTVEHMLPPPEEPQAAALVQPAPAAAPAVENTPTNPVVEAPVPIVPPAAATPVVAAVKAAAPAEGKPAPVAKGNTVVQLAALPDQHAAEVMAKNLQNKYKAQLGAAQLHPVRADLGAKGIFYRIQSQRLPDADANAICAALKSLHAGCLLVRP